MAQARKSSSRKPTLRMVSSPEFVYQLRVELLGLRPAIWRQILVRGSVELSRLHVILLMTMGWDGGHVHEYVIGDKNYGEVDPFFRPDVPDDPPVLDEAKATLAVVLGDRKLFTYIYDFGDNWQHRVKVEKILPPDPDLRSPICLAGRNACPPEDVGGGPGYIEFLEAITDPSHEDHEQLLEWCGGSFDPDTFDVAAVNERLSEFEF
ncbi:MULTISPECIES: plasmid pRiA4b ORF-3 family protein [Paraburkholderia]|uniref:plasmid pRiA4b ORF-3 family protein n=1 Tax=Paraburkholderia TaxID=1822464 RepID=UPI0022505DB2|nr:MULTISPECIES: plasmid pRiA4b ORF-3 family protein [Paraburkholderia]MCX4175154.1 plasmid pRiA4b ORF-3 family protein [Paraburkholderia madseniana]MDQ6463154.1 plasmid pRiA4b ORF-3 family protein [Paraburkholderia madseniana]